MLLVFEVLDDFFVTCARPCRVGVHPDGLGQWYQSGYGLLDALGAIALLRECRLVALRTGGWPRLSVAAIVARQTAVVLVIGERDIAARTSWSPAARRTFDDRREASAVLEQDSLMAFEQCVVDRLDEGRSEWAIHGLALSCLTQRDERNSWQRDTSMTFRKPDIAKASLLGKVVAFETWGGTAQQHLCAMTRCKHQCHFPSVVARCRVLLFV